MKNLITLFLILITLSSFAQNSTLDARAKKYLSVEQLSEISPEQKLALNYFFQKSFVIDYKNRKCDNCTIVNLDTIDIKRFDRRRAENKRVQFYYAKTGVPIILFSWKEIRQENERLYKLSKLEIK